MFNVKPFLSDCIQSIIQSDCGGLSYEILCVDDGSVDGSYEYLNELAATLPSLRVLRNEANRGVSYTRNRLMREATGSYIWFVDPDDMVCKDVIKPFYEQIQALDADILLGNYVRVAESTQGNAEYVTDYDSVGILPEKKQDFLPADTKSKKMCSVCMGLFRRAFLTEHGLTMNERMIAQEDTLFYYQLSLRTDRIYKWEVPCYLYRQRASSVMNSHNDERSKKYYLSMLEMLRVYQEHLEQKDYRDQAALLSKIHHSKQNVATCLAAIYDKAYIKEQLKLLKKEGIYPYRFRLSALKSSQSLPLRLLTFLVPFRPFFWLYHHVYVAHDKRRSS